MRKAMILLTTATLVAGSALAGSASALDHSSRAELSANQIADQFSARTARIKADLRLTPEQEKNWVGFETAMKDIGKKQGDRQMALQDERAKQKGPLDVIAQMREQARFLNERGADRKNLADAAQPLFASLDERQKQRFGEELLNLGRRTDIE